jgi:hypothetical protein
LVTQQLRLGAAITLAATLVLPSCTHPEQPAPQPSSADRFQITFRWILNPSVDLMSPEGTFIRATAESWRESWDAFGRGMDAIRERGYPGFDRAYNHSYDRAGTTPSDYWTNQVGGTRPSDGPYVGTSYFEVVALRRDGDRFSADVCAYNSQTAGKTKDGRYESRGAAASPDTFTFGPDPKLPPDQQHSPMANQRGPARRPADDVFGTWVLIDMTSIDRTALAERCKKLAPGTPADRPDPSVSTDPPPTLPPDPGWPQGSRA